MQQILLSMGEEWCRYYISDTYRPYIASDFLNMSRKDPVKFIHENFAQCQLNKFQLLIFVNIFINIIFLFCRIG